MYLKRVELLGFKSFATRTVFEFGPGVTTIVGPNGAGKSNVAEALRWVLGEQSGRHLRARKLEDIIFAGSSQRAPLGMAEVSITLDNGDGWLPLDFNEVVVTRRAHRNGESEYLINRSRVRLKDVVDLFLRAQVGQNSYAFMGQGLVEAVLSLRPEERRGLVEEAADVRRHRFKLEEAHAKLAATDENLERVRLLVRELGPRLAQLERQAERAATYTRLTQELAQALRAWYEQQWRDAQESLAAARAVCDQRQEEFQSARTQVSACEEGLRALESALEERRRDIAAREEALAALTKQQQHIDQSITLDSERRSLLETRRQELAAELDELEAARDRLSSELAEAARRLEALEAELTEARARLADREAELEAAERDLAAARQKALEAEGRTARAAAALQEAEGRLDRLRAGGGPPRRSQEREARRRALLTELSSLGQRYRQARSEERAAAMEAEALATERETLRRRQEEEQRSLVTAQERLRAISVRREQLEARLSALKAAQEQRTGFDAAIRAVLTAGGLLEPEEGSQVESTLEGIVGVVGRLLRVPPGLERAIEAALAENIQAIVVERQADALAAVDMVSRQEAGRVTVYPLDGLRELHPLALLKEKGILGVASQLVRCDRRYRPLIDTLLGRVIVVEDLEIAQRVLKRGLGSVVTLDGVLLRPVGSVSGGTSARAQELLVLGRDLEEIPEELAALDASRQDLEEQVRTIAASRSEVEETLGERSRRQQEVEARRVDAQERLVEVRGELRALRGEARWLHEDARREEALLAAAERERLELEKEKERLAREAAAARAEVERAGGGAEEATARRRSLAEAAALAARKVAALAGQQEALVGSRQAAESALQRLDSQLEKRRAQAARLQEESAALQERLRQSERQRDVGMRELAALQQDLEPARQERAQLESRERSLRAELVAGQQRLLAAERTLVEAESEVRLRAEELDALRQTIEAEGLVPTDSGEVREGDGEGASLPAWLTSRENGGFEEPLPPVRGGAQVDPIRLKERIAELRAGLRSLGPVNAQAQADYSESKERYDFLRGQMEDLREAERSLQGAITELEGLIKKRFQSTFRQVNREFQRYFTTFFDGGSAELVLTRAQSDGGPGIEIAAQPPGKRLGSLAMMSGGERALTAVALLFALLQTHPSPFCVLDEVDAMLDEANVDRFVDALRRLAQRTQFIIITHNRRTIEMADAIYGISMGRDSTSSVLSLRLADMEAARSTDGGAD
jgi:chromosome segregation protein